MPSDRARARTRALAALASTVGLTASTARAAAPAWLGDRLQPYGSGRGNRFGAWLGLTFPLA